MHLSRTPSVLSALVAAFALTLTLVPASTAAAPYDDGLSAPKEDSYYPAKGDPGVDTLHYDLDVTWDRDDRTLSGVADIVLRATADAPSFQLDLGRSMAVASVTVDGATVEATHEKRVLSVQAPVVADQRYDVRIDYSGTPEPIPAPTTRSDEPNIGMRVTKDGQLRTMQEPFGALTWYPVNDQPSDKALYDVTVHAPRGWVGVSNGQLVSARHTRKTTTTRFHLAHPVASYLTTLAVGPYLHERLTGPHGLPLNFWLPKGEVTKYLPVLRHVPADLRWLESKLGPYPFESAGAVIVPGDSAMETTTLVTFGRRAWTTPEYAREVMVHELAHQWYGDTVTPSDWSDLWMNEGMAMYLQARWSADHGVREWRVWRDIFRYYNKWEREEQGGPGAYDKRMFATSCVYDCTAAMYEKLRSKIGDRHFWALVRRWPQSRLDTNGDRAAFEALAEKISGADLTQFFDDWLNSPTWPPS